MDSAPDVIPITEFRRDAAQIIHRMVVSSAPVYVTQNGALTAVLLTREAYEDLLHRLAVQASAAPEGLDPSRPDDAGSPSAASAAGAEWHEPIASGAAPHGRRSARPSLVETRFGLLDPDTADFLAVEGFGRE